MLRVFPTVATGGVPPISKFIHSIRLPLPPPPTSHHHHHQICTHPSKVNPLPLNKQLSCYNRIKNFIFSGTHCLRIIFILTSYCLYTQVMLTLILIKVQYLQKMVLNFVKGSKGQSHSSSASHYPLEELSGEDCFRLFNAIWKILMPVCCHWLIQDAPPLVAVCLLSPIPGVPHTTKMLTGNPAH